MLPLAHRAGVAGALIAAIAAVLSVAGAVPAVAAVPAAVPRAPLATAQATAHGRSTQPAPRARRHYRIADRQVSFRVRNVTDGVTTSPACAPQQQPDGKAYTVRARLVGPRAVLAGHTEAVTVDVLWHDDGTGGWMWHLRSKPRFDYASQLARLGHTELVVDRLGYKSSPLHDGSATCLGAQVQILHELISQLASGNYAYVHHRRHQHPVPPYVDHTIVTAIGTGATTAQIEAADFADADAEVLMSTVGSSGSPAATQVTTAQSTRCGSGSTYADLGTATQFRSLLFHTAPAAVRAAAVRHRGAEPCGDVTSLMTATTTEAMLSSSVPTLIVRGADDARNGSPATIRTSGPTKTIVLPDTGYLLPLERSAPRLRRDVVAWLHSQRSLQY